MMEKRFKRMGKAKMGRKRKNTERKKMKISNVICK
jgi:hypothetical protein